MSVDYHHNHRYRPFRWWQDCGTLGQPGRPGYAATTRRYYSTAVVLDFLTTDISICKF